MSVPFITVEGPIGIGKTTLSKAIAEAQQFHQLSEIVDENPFLNKFYDDIEEWSFQTEMFFLCNRYKQLSDIQKQFISERQPVVADYHIFKNLIFAKRTLPADEYAKYEEIYHILTRDMPVPNVIIYLHASLDTLMKRIALRGRDFEKKIDPLYLQRLADDYEVFIADFEAAHPEIPVLRFNGDEIDFVNEAGDLSLILNKVDETIRKGVRQ
ncbi:deoxynucleoside kinase [Sporosarcina thermotolerans]|uniref:Deoxynucleoside kinase n=1 Tax=Sporosarcina thermotolerans TaxID=633404 RepID=A0AAW9AD42_9BACL|nr:deoxynucleoside kinase [Sporosarcina thermotolerans]MDW0118865.1 deoxynucleoside kinase [Sporosarcina thermotolerans]WHT48692.1 deoxynucleoside kinase [Sporosarcina thermotolerans]